MEERLLAISREVTAVHAALDQFDEDGGAAEADDAEERPAGEVNDQPAEIRMQRAGLEQRLSDLLDKQKQLERAFDREQHTVGAQDAAPEPKEASQKKKLVLQEDRFLDEELDNARNSAMVETERDRLIRLVSCCLIQHSAPYYAELLRCSQYCEGQGLTANKHPPFSCTIATCRRGAKAALILAA